MEEIRSSETSVLIRATRRHLPEDDNHNINVFSFLRDWQGEDAAENSSSDEEERAGPEGREEVHMEVDSTDRE
jgi:hypothetical protein